MDEREVVLRLIDGDEEAFCELYAAYKNRLLYFALKFVKSREFAEDIFQDAFTVVWQTRRFINPEASFSSYLYTIVRNRILNQLRDSEGQQIAQSRCRILICAGTGCLGLGVKRFCPAAQVTCVEKSPAAFAYLEKNARCALTGQGRQTENVLEPSALEQADAPTFDWGPALNALRANQKPTYAVQPVQADLFTYWENLPEGQLELIVSNPPYLTAAEMEQLQPEVAQEPAMALEAGEDGLVFYRALAQHYKNALCPGGALVLEIGWQQREAVTALLAEYGWADIRCIQDFGGNDRCVTARRPK